MTASRILMAAVLAAGLASPAFAADKLKVVASFSVLGDLAQEVGGDHVQVVTLVGPNGDAHMFEPSPTDAKALGSAAVLVENGLGLEHWLERLVSVSGFKGETVVATKGVKPRVWTGDADEAAELAHDASGKALDPHAWQDPKNGILYVKNIVAGLSTADPANAADYAKNGAALEAQLAVIDKRLAAEFGKLPEARRRIVTSHDAFGYFGAAYDVKFIAPEGLSTESDVSAAAIAKIIRQIKDEKITALFVENISDPRLLDQIARETGVKVGGELFSDALSPADGPAPTYVKMFENNEGQLLSAISGS
ncbi:metal ABC transporter substrate-binding protein [Kaistia dalseonensis]|uniref:Zinc/manganese transport system substrate-binding protein n=1 Tax=Kaistia dalseonensis TaxID=410840 RepID=A0ABU0H7S2_9HYPH|nr:metal ABC transporter substrate-binding protein [Kaistia dalseonensis]MCX5495244.1 metal ABC transporter substrate-binding protein [Kaistia dalseonensis]MDQ0437830.1 zinc/manganese transport system substrate-binding protein [Kaistia dalseonensis]